MSQAPLGSCLCLRGPGPTLSPTGPQPLGTLLSLCSPRSWALAPGPLTPTALPQTPAGGSAPRRRPLPGATSSGLPEAVWNEAAPCSPGLVAPQHPRLWLVCPQPVRPHGDCPLHSLLPPGRSGQGCVCNDTWVNTTQGGLGCRCGLPCVLYKAHLQIRSVCKLPVNSPAPPNRRGLCVSEVTRPALGPLAFFTAIASPP